MNIKELKNIINNLPDDMEVITYFSQWDRDMVLDIDREDNTIYIA